ncbi:hypothetical protein GF319_11710 [Candidatus Bathyarchaeota archaeon]|nr:hypothetical protein [Candidatus Bathyarchaeota archaeon]
MSNNNRVRQIVFILLALLAIVGVYRFQRGDGVPPFGNVTANEARIITRDLPGIVILDVREKTEFEEEHIEGAINIPLIELEDKLDQLSIFNPTRVYSEKPEESIEAVRFLEVNG